MAEKDLLNDLLRTQAEIRALEQEDFAEALKAHDPQGYHRALRAQDNEDAVQDGYIASSPASVPAGTPLIVSPVNEAIDVPWADYHKPAYDRDWTEFPCANDPDCLGAEDSCLSWFDCGPCQWCEDFQCVERDENRACDATWECPCPPSEDQYYNCIEGTCRLTCGESADCPEGEICDPSTFFCADGCLSDEQCDPRNANAAPDARPGSYCVNYECVTPCDPPRLCKGLSDTTTCRQGEICKDKKMRGVGDPDEVLYQCENGCYTDDQCEDFTYDLNGQIYSVPQVCVEEKCLRVCSSSADCVEAIGEGCQEGVCRNVGLACVTSGDCRDGEICNDDGRCKKGCDVVSDCIPDCNPDKDCVDSCPPDPTCTCEDFYDGADCGTTYTKDWRDSCPRDPACIASCPVDKDCGASQNRPWACIENSCFVACNDRTDCGTDPNYICRPREDWTAKGYEVSGECQFTAGGANGGQEEICSIEETCETDENGDTNCVQEETCSFVSPHVGDDFFGCGCGDSCTQGGQCLPGICTGDGECEDCSYCRNGICVPGCDEDNPCGDDFVCGPDGECLPMCHSDEDCLFGESCGEGGLCTTTCGYKQACLEQEDCWEDEICKDGFCEYGCEVDADCGSENYPGKCVEESCYDACVSDDDCDIDSGYNCLSGGYCAKKIDVCTSDSNCPPRQYSNGAYLNQVCNKKYDQRNPAFSDVPLGAGVCQPGCRSDDQCPTSMLCMSTSDGAGNCEYICQSDEECSALGYGDKCVSDAIAKKKARSYYAVLKRTGTTIQKNRWEALASSNKTGVCLSESSGVQGEYAPVCAGYETCDSGGSGTCVRLPCISGADCPDGSCLSDGECGACRGDLDCPGELVCDVDYGCDINGENCDPLPKGTCNTPCIPEVECDLDNDCPEGTYCATETNRIGISRKVCRQGCREIALCDEPKDCPRPDPSNQFCFEQACRFDFDCPPPASSGGKCRIDRDCPNNESCIIQPAYEDSDGNEVIEGFCESNVVPTCEDGRCEGATGGCPYGEICFYHNDPDITTHDGVCAYPLVPCENGICQSDSGDCYPGERCRNGECLQGCVPPDAGEDNPCRDDEECIGGICEWVGYKCSSDADCPDDLGECFQGSCRPDLRCNKHADCPSERLACVDNECVDAQRCDNNIDCGRLCSTSDDCKSRSSSLSECENTGDCEGSEQCLPAGSGTLRCQYPAATCSGIKCKTDENGEEVCEGVCEGEDPDDTRFCGPQGICLTGQACSGDDACNFPDICVGGVCLFAQRCSSDGQCGAKEYCNKNVCTPDNRCIQDEDCFASEFCNASGVCQEADVFRTDGYGSGCDSCTEYCDPATFRCKPTRCQTSNDCDCGGFCDTSTGECVDRCQDDTQCPRGEKCDTTDGVCVQKEPCLSDIDCPGQVDCNDQGFCDSPINTCLVDDDCNPGVCIDGECMDCKSDRDCRSQFGLDVGCDENGQNCDNTRLICFNNSCETPCYTGLTEGTCSEGLQYGDLCEFCPDSCIGGSSECIEDGTICGEILEWDPVERRSKYRAIPCKRCTLPCNQDTDCLQRCETADDCEQYEATGSPCDPNPGLACDPALDPYDTCPFPEESLLLCEIDGVLDSSFCANEYETCRLDPENPGEPAKCRFDDVLGGSEDENRCAMFDIDNSGILCLIDENCPDGETCQDFDGNNGVCKLPPCGANEVCDNGTCDWEWRVPTCKPNNRCLGTEADRAFDPCPFGEVCDEEKFFCVWPAPTCSAGTCVGDGLVQNSICETNEKLKGKFCEYFDGSCESDFDCNRLSRVDGKSRYCREYVCEEGEFCIGNSDCEPGEICKDMVDEEGVSLGIGSVCALGPGWNDGVAECDRDNQCSTGKICRDNACAFLCGTAAFAYSCRPPGERDEGILCPPDYTCNGQTNLCERPGYDGIDTFMSECAKGETCFSYSEGGAGGAIGAVAFGGCVPFGGTGNNPDSLVPEDPSDPDYECRSPWDCSGELCNAQKRTKWDCQTGQCVEVWVDEYPARPGEQMCTDPDRVDDMEQQNTCERQGKCCDDRGFCVSCGCDDKTPCEGEGECCDRDSGLCVQTSLHPKTEYGAPAKCSFDKIFCEVLGPTGDDGKKSEVDPTSFKGKNYSGCKTEFLADGSEYKVCWPGGPLGRKQVVTMLYQECDPYEEKDDCDCEDEPPETNECYSDLDCGKNKKCEAKTWRSTLCCPVVDEFGNDSVTRLICNGEGDDDLGCRKDSDCSECETCEGASADETSIDLGTCQPACDKLCPCGGSLSKGNTYQGQDSCPSCEDRFGEGCITQAESFTTPERVDEETGELIPAVGSCDCVVKQDNPCCEVFYDRGAAGECGDEPTLDCRFSQLANNRDGCAYREYKDNEGRVTVGQVDYCTDFKAGICARCTQDSHCPGNAVCVDHECATECGGESELPVTGNCHCCTPEAECKELYQSWSESRSTQRAGDGGQGGLTLYDGGRQAETRACACTKDGIECQPWKEQQSCYEWVLVDEGSGDDAKAERERKQEALEDAKLDLIGAETDLAEGYVIRNAAQAALNSELVEQERACEEIDEICSNAVEQFKDAAESQEEAEERLTDAEDELTELEEDVAVALLELEKQNAQVDTECPPGGETPPEGLSESCLLALEEQVVAQEDYDQLALVDLPEKNLEVEGWKTQIEGFKEQGDYWATEIEASCPDGYQPCDPLDDECLSEESGEQSPQCLGANDRVTQAQEDLTNAQNSVNDAIINLNNIEAKATQLEYQIEETIYQPATWEQRRVCGCCIDGECRDESECTYGTCYLCHAEDYGDATKYRSAFVTSPGGAVSYNTSSTELCAGCFDQDGNNLDNHKDCPSVGFINEIGGPTAIYFEKAEECVKYRCEDGIRTHQEMCSGDINSWYDYCIGFSLFGCIFKQNTDKNIYWWNGYDHTMYCPLAGTWAYNSKSADPIYNSTFFTIVPPPSQDGDWVQLTKPQENIAKSSCAYPNIIGHMGFGNNWLPPIEGMGGFHPCCQACDLVSECDPEHPDCTIGLELIFEAGDPSLLIDRIKAEIKALENYEKELDRVDGQLDDLKSAKKDERQGLVNQLDGIDTGIDDIEEAIVETEGFIGDKESDIEAQETKANDLREDYEDSEADLDSVSEEKNAAIETRDELQLQYDNTKTLLDEAKDNHQNAKDQRDKAERDVQEGQDLLSTLRLDAVRNQCVCGWDPSADGKILDAKPSECPDDEDGNPGVPLREDTVECYDLMQEIEEQVEEVNRLQGVYDELIQDVNDAQDEIDSIKEDLDEQEDPLNKANMEVTRLTTEWQEKANGVGQDYADWQVEVTTLKTYRNDLVDLNTTLKDLQQQLEAAEGDEGIKQDLEDAIDKIDEILDNIDASKDLIKDEKDITEDEIEDKQERVDDLEEEWCPESEGEDCGKPEASKRPDEGKSLEELEEEYADAVEEKEDKEKEKWYPSGQP